MKNNLFFYDGILWNKEFEPICKDHRMKMDAGGMLKNSRRDEAFFEEAPYFIDEYISVDIEDSYYCRCPENNHIIKLKQTLGEDQKYISRKIESKKYQDSKLINIDEYLIPVSREIEKEINNTDYFITAQIKNSEKRGEQVVIYAGKKGAKDKSQIFIDPKNSKMTFDQNDINPSEIFAKFEATFRDGSKTTIEKRRKINEN